MKATITFLLLVSALLSQAQSFKHLRYEENYEYLKDSARDWYEQMKYLPLNHSGSNYLSFGGDLRYQYFKFRNEEWGDAPADNDGFVLNRLLLHADWHLNSRLRIFTQLQSSVAAGRVTPPSPVELNELDMHQLFADVLLVESESNALTLRVGRQEMNYGMSRLISTREGPNNRQSFDGAKLIYKHEHVKADAFYSDYVASKKGIFNDKYLNDNVQFGGVYVAINKIPVIRNLDFYFLTQKKKKSTWSDITGEEQRHSAGARIWASTARWVYDFEGVYQFGDLADNSISAWTLSSSTAFTISNHPNSPSLGLKTEMISGDKNPDDGKIQSFNPLYPRGAYFGYAALIGPSNLFDVHPSFNVPVTKKILASVDYDLFWRYSLHDGIYNPGAQVIFPAGDGNSKFIGHQISGTLEFTPNRFLYFRGEVTWFKSGDYIKSVSAGKDIFYTGITATFKF